MGMPHEREMMPPNTEKCTALPVSGGIQDVSGMPEVGDGGKTSLPLGVSKKMSTQSGWDEKIWVFLHPRYAH